MPTEVGDLMVVADTIIADTMSSLQGFPTPEAFVDRLDCYDLALQDVVSSVAAQSNIPLKK